MGKRLRVTMPDGSKWDVPVNVIAANRAKYYAGKEFDGDVERSLREDTLPLFKSDPYEIQDWAANNMSWSDVADYAKPVEPRSDTGMFQEGWVSGDKEVVDD